MKSLTCEPLAHLLFISVLSTAAAFLPASAFRVGVSTVSEVTAHGIGETKFHSLVLNFLPEALPLVCAKVKHLQLCGPLRSSNERRWRRPSKCRSLLRMQADDRNLFDCIRDEDLAALRIYVERDGPVHVADALGETSLLVAASTGNVELMKILASAEDADVNYPSFHGGETPLMVACMEGHLGLVEYLVKEAGAEVNATNHRGDTALSLAAFWGKVECVIFLLGRADIDTEIENVQGMRAGEGLQELMRDESKDAETIALLREIRISRGIMRL